MLNSTFVKILIIICFNLNAKYNIVSHRFLGKLFVKSMISYLYSLD